MRTGCRRAAATGADAAVASVATAGGGVVAGIGTRGFSDPCRTPVVGLLGTGTVVAGEEIHLEGGVLLSADGSSCQALSGTSAWVF